MEHRREGAHAPGLGQRHLLYLGEPNDSQRAAWTVTEVFHPVREQTHELPLYPAEREMPGHAAVEHDQSQAMVQSDKHQRSRNIEAIKVHHLIPGCDKIVDELLLSVGTSIDFSHGAELGV